MSNNSEYDKDNLDLSKFQSLQEEAEKSRTGNYNYIYDNSLHDDSLHEPQRATLDDVLEVLEEIQELLSKIKINTSIDYFIGIIFIVSLVMIVILNVFF